jgi:hypothetical protein
MFGWPEEAMREAMDFLSRSRRSDLASDLNRICDSINFDDFEIMRSSRMDQIADEIIEAESITHLTDCLRRLTHVMQVAHCTLHIVSERNPQTYATRVLTTYPKNWIATYVSRKYFMVDPVIPASKLSAQGFYWDTLQASSPLIMAFWKDAQACGVGASGYTIPVTTEFGDVLALSVSSTEDAQAFRERILFHESDFYNLSLLVTKAFCSLAASQRPASFNLTDDQLLVLCAIAMGIEEEELQGRNYLYGSYSSLKQSICGLFQTRTLAQAAVLAARSGLLDDVPFGMGDILSAVDACDDAELEASRAALRRLLRKRGDQVPPVEEAERAVA